MASYFCGQGEFTVLYLWRGRLAKEVLAILPHSVVRPVENAMSDFGKKNHSYFRRLPGKRLLSSSAVTTEVLATISVQAGILRRHLCSSQHLVAPGYSHHSGIPQWASIGNRMHGVWTQYLDEMRSISPANLRLLLSEPTCSITLLLKTMSKSPLEY